jgi:ABC-2 type transport system ATP-binding protein
MTKQHHINTATAQHGAPSGQDQIISVSNLSKRYGEIRAVDDISFSVRRGEVFGMLGPNGAGKTTTIEILEGMRPADSGAVVVGGVDVFRDPNKVKSIIGVQLQTSAFFDHLSVSETVKLFGELYGERADVDAILEEVELTDRRKAYFKQLSGGQKQRLSIAVALVNKPQVLFLDEPTTALDPQARRHMWELIERIRSTGTTIMLTTHYMEEAEELCDRVAIMDSGRIVELDTPSALVEKLLSTGFKSMREVKPATLEDVFINLTGKKLRED